MGNKLLNGTAYSVETLFVLSDAHAVDGISPFEVEQGFA
jgi:methionine-rich copper-binding protein CopC